MKIEDHKKLAEEHFDNYVSEILRVHGETEEVILKCRFHFISAWMHGVKHEQNGKGVIRQAESKKTLVAKKDVVSIPVENTVTEKEPKKKRYQGKRSQFQVWVKNKELGDRFSEEDFYKEYPKVKKEAKAKRKVTRYISEMINEKILLQHPKNILEKIKQ